MIQAIILQDGSRLSVERRESAETLEVKISVETGEDCILHWGLSRGMRAGWKTPPGEFWPEETMPFGQGAIQSKFKTTDGKKKVDFQIGKGVLSKQGGYDTLSFVVYYPEANRWDNNRGKNYFIRLGEEPSGHEALIEEIVSAETGEHSWTLMHRFNLCHDLIDGLDIEGFAVIYAWLRFSAIRQLTWQRRYNTKPRELSHAQDRLTLKLAGLYRDRPELRELTRMAIGTVGRGGEGQKIRDEILQIMHRHRIKEVAGSFLEEWHQKLHNNATPDDILICEAYIEFLKRNGDTGAFYETLARGGVARERLKGFERPIVSDPDFIPHLKDALIYDFGEYLKILKSVHSATDLGTAFNASRRLIDGDTSGRISFILGNRGGDSVELARLLTKARASLGKLAKGDDYGVREIIYLDLALEEFLRLIVERGASGLREEEMFELTGLVLENIRFSYDNEEFSACSEEWRMLGGSEPFTQDRILRTRAALERMGRAIGDFTGRYYKLLQPKADKLGAAFGADKWTLTLFSEEVVRGMLAFMLSMLVHRLDKALRKKAKLGDWQVINPGRASGRIEVVKTLREVQGKRFSSPAVVFADVVKGDEEPPEGARAVITPDSVDLVSHIAVRARNAGLLFATCYDGQSIDRLKSMSGRFVEMTVNPSGDVVFEEVPEKPGEPYRGKPTYIKPARPEFDRYALGSEDFGEGIVGGKSLNLEALRGGLPEWINFPESVAIPYGVFERAISSEKGIVERYESLIDKIKENISVNLSEIKKIIMDLPAPEGLLDDLKKVMSSKAFGLPKDEDIWRCIKLVWASKWNERAYLSREKWGFPHEDLYMAILIQDVIEAEYAFVIHTVNPVNSDKNELYAEVVCGLGETLVGNYPGRALSFAARKDNPVAQIVSYPSKSIGIYGGGLIFRSDSNAEDLPGYAGAGLYDSVMFPPPKAVTLDYSGERLLNDEAFRADMLKSISEAGIHIEKKAGAPQDIEGAFSKGRLYITQSRPQVGIRQ